MATLDYVELTGIDPSKIYAATKTIVGTVAYLYGGMGLTPNVPDGMYRPARMPLELTFEQTKYWPIVCGDGGGVLDVVVGLCCESSPDSLEFQKKASVVLIDYLIGKGWDGFSYYYYHEESAMFTDEYLSEEHCEIANEHLSKVQNLIEVLEGVTTFNEAFLCLDRAISIFHQSQEQLREIGR